VYIKGIDGIRIFIIFSLKNEPPPWKQGVYFKGIDGRIFNYILNFFGNLLLEGSIPENNWFNPIHLGINLGSIPSDIVKWFAPFFQKRMILFGSNPELLVGWFSFFFHKKNLNLGSIPSSLVMWLAPFFQKRMNLSGSNPGIIVWFFNFFRKKFKNLGSNPSNLVGGFYDFIHKKSRDGKSIKEARMVNIEDGKWNGKRKSQREDKDVWMKIAKSGRL
jgi:hypothetical protein